MSSGWSIFVIVITVANIVGFTWLLFAMRTKKVAPGAKVESVGHTFDGIEELDSPLPRWWIWLFVGTILFSVLYLVLYPGLGTFPGLLGWTSQRQFDQQAAAAEQQYGPLYARLAAQPIPDLVGNEQAQRIGARLFANNCAPCHGSDARGGIGFPNLTDKDWLYGGEPDNIRTSILNGRHGVMPAFANAIGGKEAVPQVVAYVRSLSGQKVDPALADAGKQKFMQVCAACHGPEGKGNPAIGAPNLTDTIWLYGGSEEVIAEGLWKGRGGQMPAWKDVLGEHKVHVLAAYVYSQSHGE